MRPPTIAEHQVRDTLCGLGAQEVFDYIYRNNLWASDESLSGVGSQLDATAELRRQLPLLFQELGVAILLDMPCGDFSWLSSIEYPFRRYIGGDIVPGVIERNSRLFRESHPHAEFRVLDLTCDPLPFGDALLCRDCLVHLPYAAIMDVFHNIARSCIRYVFMTTFVGSERSNTDIEIGNWRPLNFLQPPFSLPEPEKLLLEGCCEEDGAYADKALGVWRVECFR
ncbi:MAG: class I SAM-dependent methyltransferase [Chlorobium sp.]|uniref:class I SAM-dependent methyltransferase n=1 Tax=Chlorobium sp. TaxID=1095 RepID=UPI0025C11745|nr:class I SAM-dependent methyltransferase [Chlorobium sp.]MCF8383558.1 class I SAM-dependent methyltransferase [Chlorobium sp.]